jgi:glycine/D-amino acid oxidase-like deaminating enzyme
MRADKTYDAAVVGAGSFGAWTAYQLRRAGQKVVLLDAYGPANSRASSGGESRIIRVGYGPDEIYSRWALRALTLWQDLFQRVPACGGPLFHRTGVLGLARDGDTYNQHNLATFQKFGVAHERLAGPELVKRYPQIALGSITWGLLESDSGVLMARRAVQAVVEEAIKTGVDYLAAAAAAPSGSGKLSSLTTAGGGTVRAETFVFACGPWLPKLFPALLGDRIFPTRQEVYFFGAPAGDLRFAPPAMPTWISLGDEFYGMPDLESRGFKAALDRHGPAFDPDTGSRVTTPDGLAAVRTFLA